MTMHVIDYEIIGDDLQFVEVELDPGEAAVGEAGAMMYMQDGVSMDTVFGDGSAQEGGWMGKLFGAGKRLLTGESMFTTVFVNEGQGKKRVAFAAASPGKIVPVHLRELGGAQQARGQVGRQADGVAGRNQQPVVLQGGQAGGDAGQRAGVVGFGVGQHRPAQRGVGVQVAVGADQAARRRLALRGQAGQHMRGQWLAVQGLQAFVHAAHAAGLAAGQQQRGVAYCHRCAACWSLCLASTQ